MVAEIRMGDVRYIARFSWLQKLTQWNHRDTNLDRRETEALCGLLSLQFLRSLFSKPETPNQDLYVLLEGQEDMKGPVSRLRFGFGKGQVAGVMLKREPLPAQSE